ncbi:methyl-accepting chemotaxis protein [Malikia sp.]|uniref:methyl-accepting chemotaxis protein n=1 Tax=Malikia sp. TaxID=2070706 RepID=UPI002635CBFD|nr:methyl-accepting chemotaxis protein [Malikia sp.]MDD2727912.1 methyl-accepting chemotaxis protein [Malikia sp.]
MKKTNATLVAASSEIKTSAAAAREADAQRKRARTLAKQQQVAERIAAASAQLSSGINEASAASEELKSASDQIAAGAEEAAGAAQESLAAFKQIEVAVTRQQQNAELSQAKAQATQVLVVKTGADVANLVTNVGASAQRQAASVAMVAELEKQAANIGDIVKAVVRIADQTNLLALNAAIEAARAGQHGKGFAVVADEVRTLAETSEKSAQQIQDLVAQIQGEVKSIAQGINNSAKTIESEAANGHVITEQLELIRLDAIEIVKAVTEVASGAQQSAVATAQALKGSENIAAAAEEQSAAAEESTKTVAEQTQALAQSEQAAKALADIADDLRNSTDVAKSAEEVASAAEELSSAVQEINRASVQISTAIEQIRRAAQVQAAGSEESAAAVTQLEKGLQMGLSRATASGERVDAIKRLLDVNKAAVDGLIAGIAASAESTKSSLRQVKDLELVSRRIDKIVDAITTVSIQTNMLAVNGSIEAARAGEFGKGFVVVATDIRNLAQDSAENADRIKDLVKNVQDQIGVVSRDLDEIVASAVAEVEKAKGTTLNLLAIEGDIAVVEKSSNEILAASNELAAAVVQVKTGVEQIATAAQQAEKAALQSAAAARQQSQGAEELAAAIEEIASLADELQA